MKQGSNLNTLPPAGVFEMTPTKAHLQSKILTTDLDGISEPSVEHRLEEETQDSIWETTKNLRLQKLEIIKSVWEIHEQNPKAQISGELPARVFASLMENEVKRVSELKNLDQESSLEYISRLWHDADLQTKYEKLEFICQ